MKQSYYLTIEELGNILEQIRCGIKNVLPDIDYSITFADSDKITIRFGSLSTEESIDELVTHSPT